MIILGVDPGFGITGYGLVECRPEDFSRPSLVEAGILKTPKDLPLGGRLLQIYDGLRKLICEFRPGAVAVEDIFSVHGFPRSAILIGHIRGTALLAAAQESVPVFSYYPLQVKKALIGNGNATKVQVQRMVQTVLGLDAPPRPDDLSDALAVALCHAGHLRIDRKLRTAGALEAGVRA
ncbi:MAG: crossover junction endodeoxyribonuclease RuvC [Elusimicrobia bacterium RIFCSPLOWO2_01_FULL_64_13]|nr:MAG: crossover junction endodeoxyribonuclease RuvC [Elusimicrobia bacterium RIFCSPHIGHO2_01_FULL_64_10]OGR96330.1 MAG: crossover junction endodeoxyribonuclease RuvC [Elusimicrobia bacterium RIFCSPLOWO2_01_FULL_64_13]